MAILYTKGAGKDDNITYLIQKRDGSNAKIPDKEMQNIADAQNIQNRNMGINTSVKVWYGDGEFNPKHMDLNDNVVVLGDKNAQEKYITKVFPNNHSNIIGWGKSSAISTGLGKSRNQSLSNDAIERWGVVSYNDAVNQANAIKRKNTSLNVTDYLGLLLNHESGHTVKGLRHSAEGIMMPGSELLKYLERGYSVQELSRYKDNLSLRNSTIRHRQRGDLNAVPADNYVVNKKRWEEEETKRIAEEDRIAGIKPFSLPGYNQKF